MKFSYVLALVLAVNAYTAQGFLFGNNDAWNDLKVTWGINPLGSNNFVSMPRTVSDAVKKGWAKEKSCGEVLGNRYVLNGDRSVILIFNADNLIAGIATAVPKGLPHNFPSKNIQKFFTEEGNEWILSAYFVDPSTVCTRTFRQSNGDRLVIKGAKEELSVPLKESEVSNFWTFGKCFWTMGNHYWADLSGRVNSNTNADDFAPFFILYNKGKLNGFGWALNADLPSARYEHPPLGALSKFFDSIPNFFSDPSKAGTLSTMHIYLDSTPQFNFC